MAETTSGSVNIGLVKGGSARIRNAGGNIAIGEAVGDVRAETTSGSISVKKANGKLDARNAGGDISIGLRWQPVPLKRGLPTTTLFGSLSTATGDSPYNINVNKDLATGKGYYAGSVGASMSKVADPIVLFASGSYTVSTPVSGLNQLRGSRILTSVRPGDSLGFSMGMAYSLNYDVSLTSSFSSRIRSRAPTTSPMVNMCRRRRQPAHR